MSSDSEDETQDWTIVNSKVLKRGEKDHAPDGTQFQLSFLQKSREAMYAALSQPASCSVKNVVECDWIIDDQVAKIRKLKGNFFNTMGYVECGNIFIRPEELIYLCQRGSVICYYNNTQLSLEGIMSLALTSIGSDNLLVYSNLKRLGYTVQRARNFVVEPIKKPWISCLYEKLDYSPNLKATVFSLMSAVFNKCVTRIACRRYYTSYTAVYNDLHVVKRAPISYKRVLNNSDCPFMFDVWKPTTKFRKSQPPFPDFRVVIASASKPLPSLDNIEAIFCSIEPISSKKNSIVTRVREGKRKYTYAVVDNGVVSFVNTSETSFEPCINEPK